MKMKTSRLRYVLMFALLGVTFVSIRPVAVAQSATPPASDAKVGALDRAQATAILPSSVFYKGQSAPVQGRNSAGIRFPGGDLVLMALVDNSGYSSAVQQTYQGYLLNEVHLQIGDKTLAPGAYGFGFIADNKVVVMDIAGNELLRSATIRDDSMTRPNPLQIIPDASSPGHFRLYLGRSYVVLSAAR